MLKLKKIPNFVTDKTRRPIQVVEYYSNNHFL